MQRMPGKPMTNHPPPTSRRLLQIYLPLALILSALGLMLIDCFFPLLPLFSSSQTFQDIEKATNLRYQIEHYADCTLDDSLLDLVLSNDPRGGNFSGLLNINRATFAYKRQVRDLYAAAIASGRYPLETPPKQIPDIQELSQAAVKPITLPPDCNAPYEAPSFKILKMRRNFPGNLVYAWIDYQHFTSLQIYAKEDGKWKFAGGKVVDWHAG